MASIQDRMQLNVFQLQQTKANRKRWSAGNLSLLPYLRREWLPILAWMQLNVISPSTNNANRKRWSAGNLSLLPYLPYFRPKMASIQAWMQLNVFQLQPTRIGKDEVLVTSLFCRIFDGNGFNTRLDAAQRVSPPTKKANRKRWSAGNLSLLPYLRREWLPIQARMQLNVISTSTNNANRKRWSAGNLSLLPYLRREWLPILAWMQLNVISPSTNNANRKRWSAGNLSLLPYLQPKWLQY